MKIISFSGAIGCGKDTAHDLLATHLTKQGFNCKKLSFANKLKDNVARMFYWDRDRLEWDFDYKEGNTLDDGSPDPACELLGMTRREVMQIYGTEAVRDGLHPDTWVITLRMDILNGVYDDVDYGFITDARFLNELTFTRDLGGFTFQLEKVGGPELTDKTQHASELEWRRWTDWDAVIRNQIDDHLTKEQNLSFYRNLLVRELSDAQDRRTLKGDAA